MRNMCTTLNNGTELPIVGFGTFLLRSPHVEEVVEAALMEGYKLIDTAAVYNNEIEIGQILKKFIPEHRERSEIFITSKMGPASHGTENAQAAAYSSLQCLQLDYLDLYLIHWPGTSGLKSEDCRNKKLRMESWQQLENLYNEGKFKAIGVSNYTVAHLEELLEFCSVTPAVLQIEVHPYLIQNEVRQFCREHGIHVQAYSSLGARSGCSELLSDPTVVRIAKDANKTCAQVLLRWAIQHNMSVIPKTSNRQRLKENLEVLDFSLSDDQMMDLNRLDQGKHYCWNPESIK